MHADVCTTALGDDVPTHVVVPGMQLLSVYVKPSVHVCTTCPPLQRELPTTQLPTQLPNPWHVVPVGQVTAWKPLPSELQTLAWVESTQPLSVALHEISVASTQPPVPMHVWFPSQACEIQVPSDAQIRDSESLTHSIAPGVLHWPLPDALPQAASAATASAAK
jgi:hypothetical protein